MQLQSCAELSLCSNRGSLDFEVSQASLGICLQALSLSGLLMSGLSRTHHSL